MPDAMEPNSGIPFDDQQRLDWLRLIRCENVGPATFRDLLNHFGSASAALDALPDLAAKGKSKRRIRIASREDAEVELIRLQQLGGKLICLGEPEYPTALRAADKPPPVLSALGSTDCLSANCVAFVGSRNASLAGTKLTYQLSKETGAEGYTIVSGLARGIDSAAHEAALTSGTVAVFAGGIDHIYPHENKDLSRRIVEMGGTLITEMPYGWQPRAQDFPRRNRIVAGLSLGLVVVEAAKRSGSLISARLANEMGRIVFAVPGSPLDPRSEGTNHLIKQGASLITSSQDIVSAIAPLTERQFYLHQSLSETAPDQTLEPQTSETDRERLLSALDYTPINVDELIRFTNLKSSQVQLILLELDLAGQLERHPGNKVSLQ